MRQLLVRTMVFLAVWSLHAQTAPNIIKPENGGSYILNSGQSEILTATSSIRLLPGTHIKSGANFHAYITSNAAEEPLVETDFSDENYVYTRIYQRGIGSDADINLNSDVIESIAYFDGLGRLMQQIAIKASPDLKDIVTHIEYDDYGRAVKDFLPYADTDVNEALGSFRSDAKTDTYGYYTSNYASDLDVNNPNPFSEIEFEPSPLNRVLKQAAPGEDWKLGNGHEIKFEYQTNTDNEVYLFDVSLDGNYIPSLSNDGFYNRGELIKNVIKDENWTAGNDHTTQEFTDKQGRVILKRTFNENIQHDTYYVYDDFGNLTYVLPPKVTHNGVSQAELDGLCYQYRYDHRNRLIEKKIPGKGWEHIVYNKLDLPVMTQDANQRAKGQWLFTKYDAFGRVAVTGIFTDGGLRKNHQAIADSKRAWVVANNSQLGYDNGGYPTYAMEELTINYYDDYNTSRDGITKPSGSIMNQNITNDVKGLPTVSKVKVLDQNQWISTLTAYDQKGRLIYTKTENPYLGTTDIIETKLDFVGKVLETKSTHTKDNKVPIVVTDEFEYDHVARLKSQEQTINGQTETLVSNTYDGIGQLIKKDVGNTKANPLQEVDYTYNVRGWLKNINDVDNIGNDLFSFAIAYNDIDNNSKKLFNGNISQTTWNTASINIPNTNGQLNPVSNTYTYSYDALNRITKGIDNTGNYNVTGITYDKNGNIKTLNREGHTNSNNTTFGTMDQLTYAYDDGNKLLTVSDGIDGTAGLGGFKDGSNSNEDYDYDANGNMKLDRNKDITSITYNHLNLPTSIDIHGQGTNFGNITYIYDATGTKLKKEVYPISSNGPESTEYAGNYIYENGNLKQFSTSEGYVEPKGNDWQYVYYLKDHQNNVRITFADDNDNGEIETGGSYSEIRREQNYYPFGLEHKGYNTVMNGAKNNLKTYQDQEFTEDLGLNTHEWKYRVSDPAIGRFWQIDPLAVEYSYQSPYNFSENRVVDAVELEGLEKVSVHILGKLGVNSSSKNVLGTAVLDLGNNNRLDFALAIEGTNTINGSYTEENGFSFFETPNNASGNKRLAESITNPDGVLLPDFVVQIGIENKKEEVNPSTIEEALALTPEEVEANELFNFALNSLSQLISEGLVDTYISSDGSVRTTKDENGNTRRSEFTTVYSYKLDEFEYRDDGVYFNGQILLQYTEEEILDNDD